MCLKVPPYAAGSARAGGHHRPCRDCLIKSIKNVLRHFWVQTVYQGEIIIKEDRKSSPLEADIALVLE